MNRKIPKLIKQIKVAYKGRSFWQGLRLFVLLLTLLSLLLISGEQFAWIFGDWLRMK